MQVVHTFVCLLHILAKVCLNRGEFLLGKLCHNWHIYNAEYHFGNQIWKQFYSHRKSSFFIHNLSFASKVSMIRDTEVFTNYFDHYPYYHKFSFRLFCNSKARRHCCCLSQYYKTRKQYHQC